MEAGTRQPAQSHLDERHDPEEARRREAEAQKEADVGGRRQREQHAQEEEQGGQAEEDGEDGGAEALALQEDPFKGGLYLFFWRVGQRYRNGVRGGLARRGVERMRSSPKWWPCHSSPSCCACCIA